jgi:Sigma-70 factor, region 1.2
MAELFLDQGDAIAPRSTGAVNLEDDVMPRAAASPIFTAESGLTRYLEEIRRLPMLEPHEEFMLAKRWREQGDREAAHRLVTSHLRLVAKIAMGYRGYGLLRREAALFRSGMRSDLRGARRGWARRRSNTRPRRNRSGLQETQRGRRG